MLKMRLENRFITLFAVVGLAFGFALPSMAQIDEIIVTAQKRTESLQDVPIAVSAISGDELDNLGVQQASDILTLFPNLNTNAANEVNLGFTIRGVGTNNFHANAVSAVGIYQDEVSRGTPFSSVLGVYDMERVEVLRGPQNTLFGRNTTGGAINYISKKPEIGEPNGYAKFVYGTHNQLDFELAYGFSLSDEFAIRISGESRQRDGLFTNQAPGREGEELGIRDRNSFRIQALWEITDRTELLFNYHVGRSDSTNVGNKAIGLRDPDNPGAGDPMTNRGYPNMPETRGTCLPPTGTGGYERVNRCVNAFGFNPSTNDWHTVYNVSSAIQQVEIDGFFLKLTHEFNNGMQLTSITAYDDTTALNADENGGADTLTFLPSQDGEYEQFSQELRLQGEAEKYRWILGFYHFVEDQRLATMVRRDRFLQAHPGTGLVQIIAYNFLDQEDEDNSVYGQIEYDITDATTITAGLRYTDNTKPATSLFGVMQAPTHGPWGMNQIIPVDQVLTQTWLQNQLDTGANGSLVPQFNVCRNVVRNGADFVCSGAGPMGENGVVQLDMEEWGGKFGIDHQLNDNTLLYASYSRGFKAGGHDTRALAANNPLGGAPVGPETLDSYELGVKWENADSTLRINTALFYSVWGDQQIFAVVDAIPGIYNIEESVLQGLDLELLWAPDDTWLISAGVGLLDSEIEDNGGLTVAEEGHETRNTPDMSLTAAISKDVPLAGANLNFFTKARYQDESIDLFETALDEWFTHDSQFVWDVRITYEFGDDLQYAFSLWGENLTEERFCHDIGTLDGIGTVAVFRGPGPNQYRVDDLSSVGTCSPSDGETLYGISAKMRF